MKKLKIAFYSLYILTVLVVLYFSIDIMIHRADYLEKINFATIKKIPGYTIALLLFLSALMIVELALENTQIFKLRKKLAAKDKEVLELKAKLYDKGEGKQPAKPESEPKPQ